MALGLLSAGRSEKRSDLVSDQGRTLPRGVLGKRPGSLRVPLAYCAASPGLLSLAWFWGGAGSPPRPTHCGWSQPQSIPGVSLSSTTWEAPGSSRNQARLTTAGGGTIDLSPGDTRDRDRRHFSRDNVGI